MNNTAIRRGYNRAIEWNYCDDDDAPLRDRLALFRPCFISIAIPAHGVDSAGEVHHRCRVVVQVEEGGLVAAYLDVSDADYRAAIVRDVPRLLELGLPAFADDPMELGISRAKIGVLDDCLALLHEYDTLVDTLDTAGE